MQSRAMVIVAAGSSRRFNADKLWSDVAGKPLLAHTVDGVAPLVDQCVVVTRSERIGDVRRLRRGISVVDGGPTRTESEMAGITAVDDTSQLIGIHDGARPLASSTLVESLFRAASEHGGAVPVLTEGPPLLDRETLRILSGATRAQTPQIFRASVLREAYGRAQRDGFVGLDTAEVVARYTDCEIKAVPGERLNLKVTYPADLEAIRPLLEGTSHTSPR